MCVSCRLTLKSVPQGAATQLYAAVSDDVLRCKSGQYLDDCGEGQLQVDVHDEVTHKLMKYSEEVTGLAIKRYEF